MVRIEKFFFSKLIEKSETYKNTKKKVDISTKNFFIRLFILQKMAFFRNSSKILKFFEFSDFFLTQPFLTVFKVTEKKVFIKKILLMWPRKIIENDQNFCRIFRFFTEILNFLAQNFFYRFYCLRHSFVQKIRFLYSKTNFLSIFIDFGRKLPFSADPPLPWGPCPGPPIIRTCPEKTSQGPKMIDRNLQKISG